MDKPVEIVKAIVNKVKGTNADMAQQRLDICLQCENFSKQLNMCRVCKCFLSIKVHNAGLHCPVNKW